MHLAVLEPESQLARRTSCAKRRRTGMTELAHSPTNRTCVMNKSSALSR